MLARQNAARAPNPKPVLVRLLLLAGLLGLVPPAAAWAQSDNAEYDDMGFYQSYATSRPSDPSEAWLLAYGGRLYDTWWASLLADPPDSTHPAYPEQGRYRGAETWRCVECHGWDYRGKDGVYGAGRHATGIKGIAAMAGADPKKIAGIIRDQTHGYSPEMIPDDAVSALALFVSKGQVDSRAIIDPLTRVVRGNRRRGRRVFQNLCAICHGFTGQAWITGEDDGLRTLAGIASDNPWRAAHKVLNGQTYADMPAMRAFDLQTALDVLSYAQTLPRD